jgi:hypothetical protein
MKTPRLVFGLYDATAIDCDCATRSRLRDLSLSWARFGYQGPVIEGTAPQAILDKALELGHSFCLLLSSGTIFDENWYPAHWGRRDVHGSLAQLMDDGDFLAAGRPLEDLAGSFKIDERCLLVNLRCYHSCGRPPLEGTPLAPIEPARSAGEPQSRTSSWLLHHARNGSGATYRALDPAASGAIVHLLSVQGDHKGIAPYLGRCIERLPEGEDSRSAGLTPSQRRLLQKVRGQVSGARHGVFPWNLESYDDVDVPPPGLESPLASLYCVAAGFKPYRILYTHGFDQETRVVLFDYSAKALEFRQRLLREWDGTNYPAFLRKAFREGPPDTYFQLWAGLAPAEVADSDVDQLWKAEIDRWGDQETFQKHWNLCRSLPHEFVLCDLLENAGPLLERVRSERNAAVWWSNAFFTIYSNWLFTIAERRSRYARFVNGLASRAPALFLYGADHVNSSVNSVRADEYAALLGPDGRDAGDGLIPARFHRLQIRS